MMMMITKEHIRTLFGCLFVRNAFVLFLFALLCSVLATLDLYNVSTISRGEWVAIAVIGFFFTFVSWLAWFYRITMGPQSESKLVELMSSDGSASLINSDDKKNKFKQHRMTCFVGIFGSSVLTFRYILLLVQTMFIYMYKESIYGFQSELNSGFQTGSPTSYIMLRKAEMLQTVQHIAVQAVVHLVLDTAIRYQFPSPASAEASRAFGSKKEMTRGRGKI